MSNGLPGDLTALPKTGKVVVGFSGGADSCALAHWLASQIDKDRLVLAHVHHGLRGGEADRDETFCQNFAETLGVAFTVHHTDVAALARERGQTLEECGRAVRYAFFEQLAAGEEDRILTAHTADDNAETLLLHLTRGAGPTGLQGIPPVRGKVLRPLLGVTRVQIEAYCQAHHIDFVTDSTNFSTDYARNRIRLEVLPVLKELNPRAVESLGRTAALQRRAVDYLHKEVRALLSSAKHPYGLNAAALQSAHETLRDEAVKLWLESKCPGRIGEKHVLAAVSVLTQGGAADMPGGLSLRCAQGVLSLEKPALTGGFSISVTVGETPLPDGRTLVLTPVEPPKTQDVGDKDEKINNLLFNCAIDCAIIKGDLTARTRQPGDRFAPRGRGVTKPIKQIFQESAMPPALRESAVLLTNGGQIVFCEGIGAAEGCGVTKETKKALLVVIRSALEENQ